MNETEPIYGRADYSCLAGAGIQRKTVAEISRELGISQDTIFQMEANTVA